MLTSRIVKDVPIPHEPGEWVRLRMLSGKKLQEAQDAQTHKQLAIFRSMGADGVQAMKGLSPEQATARLRSNPLSGYDIDILLRSGIVAWSYEEKVTPQVIEDLDPKTREWAATELLRMSVPELFEDAAVVEGNG